MSCAIALAALFFPTLVAGRGFSVIPVAPVAVPLASVTTASEHGFGAGITLLAVTGLTHRRSYGDIFAVTVLKAAAACVVTRLYCLTGLT